MKKILYISLAVIIVLCVYVFTAKQKESTETPVSNSTQNRMMSIENFVKLYISELSPVPEVLGGRFYVTSIEISGESGVVAYEDGHIALTADFKYETEESGAIKVTSFIVRE